MIDIALNHHNHHQLLDRTLEKDSFTAKHLKISLHVSGLNAEVLFIHSYPILCKFPSKDLLQFNPKPKFSKFVSDLDHSRVAADSISCWFQSRKPSALRCHVNNALAMDRSIRNCAICLLTLLEGQKISFFNGYLSAAALSSKWQCTHCHLKCRACNTLHAKRLVWKGIESLVTIPRRRYGYDVVFGDLCCHWDFKN